MDQPKEEVQPIDHQCIRDQGDSLVDCSVHTGIGLTVVMLARLKEIRIGQNTPVFKKNKKPEHESVSFSIIYADKTLDLICKTDRERDMFYISICKSHISYSFPLLVVLYQLGSRPQNANPRASSVRYAESTYSFHFVKSMHFRTSTDNFLAEEEGAPTLNEEERVAVKFKGKRTVVEKRETNNDLYSWGKGSPLTIHPT